MSDLVGFLRARLDERERKLREIQRQRADYGEKMRGGWNLWGDFGLLVHEVCDFDEMLAEVAAKRARLSLIADLANSNDPTMAAVGRQLMRGEAQPYAEHPEADPDWRLNA